MAEHFNIADMYIPLERCKPDEDNERAFEHNKIVSSYDNPEGQEQARASHQYWSEEFPRVQNGHAQRMLQISKGLAGVEEPWFNDVGRLTPEDRKDLMAFAQNKTSEVMQPKDPELETLMKNLDARQKKEAIDLTDRQENQIHGDAPNWLSQRHVQERQDQNKQFADERERYTAEHNEAKHILEEMRQQEKQEALERGDKPEEESQKFSR